MTRGGKGAWERRDAMVAASTTFFLGANGFSACVQAQVLESVLVVLAQAPGGGGGKVLLWVGGGILALAIIGAVVFFLMKGEGGKGKAKTLTVTESQIGNYRLINLMMTGQTSQVWEVSELGSGRHFAMKLLLPEHVHTPAQRNFLFHEAEVGKQLGHAKIIKILSMIRDPDNPYILMEFFPGSNLETRIRFKDAVVKEHAHSILEQAATGLAFMNEKGFVHRDVKPANILVNSAGEVRLIDFALTQRVQKPGMMGKLFRKRKKAQGTRSYMSPEQIRGEWLDGRADLYSFGVTIFEVVTGRPPFRAASPQELLQKQIYEKAPSPKLFNPEVTDELASLVLKMLAKKREDRPRDFHEFLTKFRSLRLFKNDPVPKKSAT